MKFKQVLFSAIVSAGIGAVVGLGVAEVAPPPYQSRIYTTVRRNYPLIGAIAGFLGGGIISAVQQLHKEYDRRDR
jgi:hypothetical protein